MSETVVVGGGVIGLTSAYLLAKQGISVTVIDQRQIGQEASWAGAGMLPPVLRDGPKSLKTITKQSAAKWPELSQELLSHTGIDNGYRNCGAIQISLENPEHLSKDAELWNQAGAPTAQLDNQGIQEQAISPEITSAFRLPTMSQVRNPRHLKALKEACFSYGVNFIENQAVRQFETSGDNVKSVVLENRKIHADSFVISTGAWTNDLLKAFSLQIEIIPIRGQIVLMKLPNPHITHIIEDGPRYLVPREDGHLLIGSTEENVGFVKATTENGVQGLIDFAIQ
ncbi:MAG: FAD-dependent oxidoreductase, partial [Planctomicrobium sp.]|nr:FAD-dependent oxidoreductase [Planctomicrobium sp.]